MRTTALLLLAISLALLPACATSPRPGDHSKAATETLAASPWTLRTIDGRAIPETERPPTLTITLAGAVGGHAGVNRFAGRTDPDALKAGRVTFSSLITTKMAGPPELMRLESDYLAALGRAAAYRASGDSLTLVDAAGAPVLTFGRD